MEETVTQWEPNRLLEFKVLTVPPAMSEASIYDHVETPHLHGYFVPQRGRFTLTPLPNGRTRLEGTSWYSHQIWPQAYWSPITERVVHGIHQRCCSISKRWPKVNAIKANGLTLRGQSVAN